MTKNSLILTLDMGTSSVRAMLFDRRGRPLPEREVQRPYAQRTTGDGGVETDAEMLLEQTVTCLRDLLRKSDDETRKRIAGVGVSCFWHSLIGVGSDHKAVTPVYSWADTRSRAQAERLQEKIDSDAYHARTGCVLHTSYWPAKLLWLHETHPELFAQVTRWMSFGEYVTLRLFGNATCSLSMASGTGLFDQNAAAWDEAILGVLPITPDQLNPLTDCQPQSGLTVEYARVLAPLRELPWLPALGDGACSNIGSSAVTPERIAINVGTSAAMRVLVAADSVQIRPGLFCYRVDRGRFLLGGAFADGGNVYAWQHATLQLSGWDSALRRLSTMPPDGHGLTVLPFWAGERSTGWHVDARAAILGMNLHTTPLDILRASLEGITYRFAAVRDLLLQNFPDVREVVASGGAVLHLPAWMQIMADVFGSPVIASRVAEASSRGAALHALESLGLMKDLSDAPLSQGRTYKPNMENHAVYRKAYDRQADFYARIIEHG